MNRSAMRRLRPFGSTALLLLAGATGGCYEDIEGAPPPPRAQAVEEAPEVEAQPRTSRSNDAPRASGSTLGQAKNSAKRTVGALEERQRELEKELEDQ